MASEIAELEALLKLNVMRSAQIKILSELALDVEYNILKIWNEGSHLLLSIRDHETQIGHMIQISESEFIQPSDRFIEGLKNKKFSVYFILYGFFENGTPNIAYSVAPFQRKRIIPTELLVENPPKKRRTESKDNLGALLHGLSEAFGATNSEFNKMATKYL